MHLTLSLIVSGFGGFHRTCGRGRTGRREGKVTLICSYLLLDLLEGTLKTHHNVCLCLGWSRGDGPSWTTWRKGINGKIQFTRQSQVIQCMDWTFKILKYTPWWNEVTKKSLKNCKGKPNCVCYSHGNILLSGVMVASPPGWLMAMFSK